MGLRYAGLPGSVGWGVAFPMQAGCKLTLESQLCQFPPLAIFI